MPTITGAVAEMELELIVERIRKGPTKDRRYGTHSGRPVGGGPPAAAPNASCGVKPQAARGSGAEPVAAAAVIYVQANPGWDTKPQGAGFSGYHQAIIILKRKAFLLGCKRSVAQAVRPEALLCIRSNG